MTRHVAFLRAINVGGRRVSMDRLTAVAEDIGCGDVSTYIASGNVLFSSRKGRPALEVALEAAFADALGFEVPTFVRTRTEVQEVVGAQPFEVPDGHTHMVAFLRAAPSEEVAAAVAGLATATDDLVVAGDVIHWHIHGPSMASSIKDSAWKGTGIGPLTTRNITMLRKLAPKLAL
ncbi:MAG: DUF1697 domain-containing protein [Acidimicrobiales bacterium]